MATPEEIKQICKGKTPEQKQAIQYFLGSAGCMSKVYTDEAYEAAVMAIAHGTDFKTRALNKLGVDESQVNEIPPVYFEGYMFDSNKAYAKLGKDNKWRSSAYQVSWLFFSDSQVYVYQYTFNMDDNVRKEATEEYFYKDVTNFSSVSDTKEFDVVTTNCMGSTAVVKKTVNYDKFALVVPGEKFTCSMVQTEYTERAIQGMKAKLREKKA